MKKTDQGFNQGNAFNTANCSIQSIKEPLKEDRVVLPKLPKEAKSAYCVAEKARPVRKVKKDTKAIVEKAVVKLSTRIVANSKFSFAPT